MKIGFVGTGMIVQDLLRTVDTLSFEKKYILGTLHSKEKTERIAKEYQFDGVFFDYDALLESEIDTVYIALPNHLHYSFSKQAILAGKNCIIEKPITANIEELEELIQLAKERNVMIFEAMSIHHMPAYLELKKHLDEIGKIRIVSLNYSQYSSRYNAFKNGEILPAFDYHKAGGALMDLNVYNIHFLTGLFGNPEGISYLANVEKGIDTSGILSLDYGTFKAVAIGAKDCKASPLCSIQGDEGCIQIHTPVNGMTKFEVESNGGEKQSYVFDAETHRLFYEFQEFIDMIEHKDLDKMNALLECSITAMRIITEARKQAGIVFDNDLRGE